MKIRSAFVGMDKNEIYKELNMSYDAMVEYLLGKYGPAKYDYFSTPECKTKNSKVVRTAEGLYCHHMDEDKEDCLSDPTQAKLFPFECQRKERLVYCNILEHLILHVKIQIKMQKRSFSHVRDLQLFFDRSGINLISQKINDIYMDPKYIKPSEKVCFDVIKDNYPEYITILDSYIEYAKSKYEGPKTDDRFLKIGGKVQYYNEELEISQMSDRREYISIKKQGGEELKKRSLIYSGQFQYLDVLDVAIRQLACGYYHFYSKVYDDLCAKQEEGIVIKTANALNVDFRGFGHVQFAGLKLDAQYGSRNADEYISKAIPMCSNKVIDLSNKKPVFWQGESLPPQTKKQFYIVRVRTAFSIKKGHLPFIRYRENDVIRRGFKHSWEERDWTVLKTSDIYDAKTDKWYSKYNDRKGGLVDATVILTLGREDFELFQKEYDIRIMEILDGCYFFADQ